MTRASSGDQSKAPGACVCRCEGLALRFQQRDADAAAWEEVPPGACCDYAWEEPQGPRRLRVWIDGGSEGLRDCGQHEYGLDAIRVRALHPCCYVIRPA